MDEFQRFKYLIHSEPESETGMLANKFFNSDRVRMLLLSATPYKMYSTLEEIDENQVDEHYSEFFDVMNFLKISKEEQDNFREVWTDYSVKLKELSKGNTTIITAKRAAEDAMYQHVCRTERISAVENAVASDLSNAFVEGFEIGGKTATSEKLPRRSNKYIASFLGFAPASNPTVVGMVIIDEPQGLYYGGTIAAPVMGEVFETILPYLGLECNITTSEE